MGGGDPLDFLPHRAPFRFLDRCEIGDDGASVHAAWTPATSWDVFAGHFPGHPVVPGVILIETMAQAACILGRHLAPETAGRPVALVGVDHARFRRPVHPGETLVIRVDLLRRRGDVWQFRAVATVGGETAAEAELLAAVPWDARP